MAKTKRNTEKTKTEKDVRELKLALAAMKGTQHNPIDWGAIIAFIAPIIARIAARRAAIYLSQKLRKRLPKGTVDNVADYTAEKVEDIIKSLAGRLSKSQ